MKIFPCFFPLMAFLAGHLSAQAQHSTALWDDQRVSAVYISLPQDTIDSLYAHPYDTRYHSSTVIYDDGTVRDTLPQVGVRLRGNTSRSAAKKSFKLSFNQFVPGRHYQGIDKLNLNGQHNDPTMIREKLFYNVWNACGLPQRRTTFVRLYLNGIYHGLYTCLEEIDKDWLTQALGENDGNLYKCTYPSDLVYHGADQQSYKNILSGSATGGRAYDLQTNEALDDYTDLVDLITQLDRVPDAQFEADIPQYLDVNAMLLALAIDVATGNWDDYAYNKNNYFLYHHLGSGQMKFITYDTDNTFGVDWLQKNWATRDCRDWLSHSEPRPLASKLLDVPPFRAQYYAYLDSITRRITRPDSIFPKIDAMRALIYSAAVADTFRSLDYGYTLADFDLGYTGTVDWHTPYGIKPFLQTRYTQTLSQLATVQVSPTQNIAQAFELYPNPVTDGQVLTLRVSAPLQQSLTLILINALGQSVGQYHWPAHTTMQQLDLKDLPVGKYWIRMKGNGIETGRYFVKQ
jgi:CotH kinase protein/Secretion system C-terminal sorting domain